MPASFFTSYIVDMQARYRDVIFIPIAHWSLDTSKTSSCRRARETSKIQITCEICLSCEKEMKNSRKQKIVIGRFHQFDRFRMNFCCWRSIISLFFVDVFVPSFSVPVSRFQITLFDFHHSSNFRTASFRLFSTLFYISFYPKKETAQTLAVSHSQKSHKPYITCRNEM